MERVQCITPGNGRQARSLCGVLAMAVLLFFLAVPLSAQCEIDCGGTPEDPPEITISPDGGTYATATAGGSVTVPVGIGIYDPDGLVRSSLQVTLASGSTTRNITTSWSSPDGKRATLSASLAISYVGDNVLTVRINDTYGNNGIAAATYTLTYTPPPPPPAVLVDTSVFHSDYRNITLASTDLAYTLQTATVYGTPGQVSLAYNSEQAAPTAYFQIDARPDASVESAAAALSLRIEERDAPGTPATREYYWATRSGYQRLAAHWDMSQRLTGAHHFIAIIRALRADGSVLGEKRVPFRILIANERGSRYGAGWSIAGVQRIHKSSEGLLLNEGNGTLLWFANPGCAAGADCLYTRPQGDFSTVRFVAASNKFTRTFSDNTVIDFTADGLMTGVTDRVGRVTSFQWQKSQDGQNVDVLARIVDPAGQQAVFGYHPSWYLKNITAAGRSFEVWYSGVRPTNMFGPSNLKNITYTTDGLLAAYTEDYGAAFSRTFSYTYDAYRALRTATNPAVTVNGASVTPQTSNFSLASVTVPGAGVGTSSTNLAPPLAPENALVETRDPAGHATRVLMDRFGNSTKLIDAAGVITTITRNSAGLPEFITTPTSNTGYSWDAEGRMIETRVNGAVTYKATYTGGLLTQESTGQRETFHSYGPRGELLRSWYGTLNDSVKNGTTFEYNSRYQLIRVTTPNGGSTVWGYDWNPFFNPDFQRVNRPDGTVIETRYTYTADSGMLKTAANAYGGGNESATYSYDALHRVTSILDGANGTVTYTYTGPHQTRVTDRAGKKYEFVYNALGWLIAEKFPDGRERTYRYDIDGLPVGETDRRLRTVTRSYDALHRPYDVTADGATTSFRYPDVYTTVATNAEATITTKVAAATGMMESYSIARSGRMYEIKPGHEATDAYRAAGLDIVFSINGVVSKTDTLRYIPNYSPTNANTSYTLGIQDPAGSTSVAGFDASGRPSWTQYANAIGLQNTYTADGRLTAMTYSPSSIAGQLTTSFSHDNNNRLFSRTSGNLYSWVYYDTIGRLTTYHSQQNGATVRAESYTYDPAGNRTDRGSAVQPNSNRYAAFNGYTIEYDEEGNITRKYNAASDQRFAWNALGQLTSVTTNGVTVSYGYDPLGNRFRRTQGTATNFYVYFGGNLLLEADSGGAATRMFTYWPGTDHPLTMRVPNGSGYLNYYYAVEPPGHVTGVMDASGGVVARYRYTPWGEIESRSGTLDQPLQFMAREVDASTGLHYVRNRWYDTSLARFISEDPIGLAGGLNTYAYAENDPVNRRDPSGLVSEPDDWYCYGYYSLAAGGVMCAPVRFYNFGMGFGNRDVFGSTTSYFSQFAPHSTGEPAIPQVKPRELDEYEQWAADIAGSTAWLNDYTMFWAKLYGNLATFGRMGNSVRGTLFLSSRHGTTVVGHMDDVIAYTAKHPGVHRGGWAAWDSWGLRRKVMTEWRFVQDAIRRGDKIVNVSADGGGRWTRLEEAMANISGYHVFP